MADLKSLFAKKADNAQPNPSVAGTPAEPKSESPTNAVAPAETQQPQDTKPKKPVFGVSRTSDQPGGSNASSSESPSGSEQPKPGLSALRLPTGARDSSSPASAVAAPALDSLDALNSSEDEGVAPRGGSGVTYFADETPAIKPTRELPEGVTKEQLGFVENLDTIYEVIHDADLLGGVIRNIMIELKSQPEYTKLMAPDDFRTMVRGMRESMGLARVKKQESKAKKSGGTRKSKALDDDVMAGLDDILGGIDL